MDWVRVAATALTLVASPAAAQETSENSAVEREVQWMRAVVQQLTATLVDPDSANVSLPFGFTNSIMTWRVWGVEMTGYFTCGVVNSRNRMGGYVGNTAFLGYISPEGKVTVTLDDPSTAGQRYGGLLIEKTCVEKRQQGYLPTIRPDTLAALSPRPTEERTASITEELAKLAKLHADGALSEEEFAAAKQRLLARN